MTVHSHDFENRGSYKSGGEGRGGGHWTREAPPERDRSLDPHHVTNTVPSDFRKVKGWGADLHERPMYPMELPSDVKNVRGDVRDWQVPHDKVHMSIEQPGLTPVFGTSCPPRGLSGLLRDYAYKYSEGTNRHWMTLVIADRVDILESMVVDALRGHPDRYIKERAWSQNLKYGLGPGQKKRMPLYIGGAILAGLAIASLMRRD